ncbi:hypothetical protein ACFV2Q_34830, partial [Streptomyces sp. NPDC059650]|uniref:hypothetical protein n=1 Tax=Streptomyces sp. NPDC059650 TaxID=3346896 RepID=UPI00367BD80A
SGLQDEVAADIEHGTLDLAVRSCVAVVAGATALGLAVYRRPRPRPCRRPAPSGSSVLPDPWLTGRRGPRRGPGPGGSG